MPSSPDAGPDGPPDANGADAGLAAVRAAYTAGDYRRVRALLSARAMSAGGSPEATDESVALELSRMRARTAVDSVQIAVLAACAALLCAVMIAYAN